MAVEARQMGYDQRLSAAEISKATLFQRPPICSATAEGLDRQPTSRHGVVQLATEATTPNQEGKNGNPQTNLGRIVLHSALCGPTAQRQRQPQVGPPVG